jgi:hypothetical protein
MGDAQVLGPLRSGSATDPFFLRYQARVANNADTFEPKVEKLFLQIVRGIARACILCVSLDIICFHPVMMHNAYGEVEHRIPLKNTESPVQAVSDR